MLFIIFFSAFPTYIGAHKGSVTLKHVVPSDVT